MSHTKTKKSNNFQNKFFSVLKFVLIAILLAGFLAVGAVTGLIAAYLQDEPVRSAEQIRDEVFSNDLTGFAYFSDTYENGNYQLIGMLRADEDRQTVSYDEISPYLIDAVVAIEDRDYWKHSGINFTATIRAVIQQLTMSDVQTGGSTITQQLAKNTFYSSEKSYERKIKEMFLALRMERFLSKEEIFTAYVNKINYGKAASLNNVYGIQAASKGYFNKDASDLNLAEAAYLAGVPQRPYAYSSFNTEGFDEEGYEYAMERQSQVLDSMLIEGYITQAEFNEAASYDIKEAFAYSDETSQKSAYNNYPYLMLEIEDRAAEKIVETIGITTDSPDYNTEVANAKQELLTGGYKVYTTIDKKVYEAMNDVVQNPDNFSDPRNYTFTFTDGSQIELTDALEQVGATLIDNDTGAILGFVGGRDFTESQVNHSNFRGTSDRQPGSSIKPILDYGPAIELGYISPATPIDDIPLGTSWEPDNWNHKYNGRITAREALKWSYNIPAVKVYEMVGQNAGYEYYTKVGLEVNETFFKQGGLTPSIGSIETSPERLTSAYTTFANGGIYIDSYLIERIEDKDGNIIFEHQSQPEVVYSEETSYIMTDMLRSVVSGGTGTTVRNYIDYSIDVAGKTGTTNDNKDAWFIGYTTEVTLGVWVGYDYPVTLRNGAIASQTWGKMLESVIALEPELAPVGETFDKPSNVVKMEVSSSSGTLPSDLTKQAGYLVTDWFNKKYIPTETDDTLEVARVVTYDNERYIAKYETPDDMVETGIYYKREPYTVPEKEPGDTYTKQKPVDFEKELPNSVDPRTTTGAIPAPPQNLIFKESLNKNVISWDKNPSPFIAGYRIYRYSLLDAGFEYVGSTLQTNTFTTEKEIRTYFEDMGTINKSYIYYITSVDIVGNESSPSVYVGNTNITPPSNGNNGNGNGNNQNENIIQIPSEPSNLMAEFQIINNNITLSWNQNPINESVVKYNVYYSNEQNGSFSLAGSSPGTTFMHSVDLEGSIYYYVTAVNSKGESNPSSIIKVENE